MVANFWLSVDVTGGKGHLEIIKDSSQSSPEGSHSSFMDGVHPAKKFYPKISFQREDQPKNIRPLK